MWALVRSSLPYRRPHPIILLFLILIILSMQVRADLPVGQNLQSHVGTGEVVFTLQEAVSYNPVRLLLNPLNSLAYLVGEGPLGRLLLIPVVINLEPQNTGFYMDL
jgi:hypothetical protein